MSISNSETNNSSKTASLACVGCLKGVDITRLQSWNGYELWQCGNCALQFWTPFKNPGSEWYAHDERNIDRSLNPLRKPERNHREFLKDIPARGGKLLDVGMGTGNFLAGAVAEGYDGYGIDFDDNAVRTAQDIFKLKNVYNLDLEGVTKKFGEHFFNVITLFEVLEHIDDLSGFMGQIKMNLKPRGYLGISVPYRNCPNFLKPNDLPPRHLTRWNKMAMKNFLEMHGFKVEHSRIIRVTIPYLITKFHFWLGKYTSMNLVRRMKEKSVREGSQKNIDQKVSRAVKLARAKDYILFSIPAVLLYLFLIFSRKSGLGLYVLGKRRI